MACVRLRSIEVMNRRIEIFVEIVVAGACIELNINSADTFQNIKLLFFVIFTLLMDDKK